MASAHLDNEHIVEMIEKMPAFPRSVQQVLSLADDINCNPRELVRVVEHDPVLTGRMLKVVNSAYFGLSRRISTVKEALAFVGLNTLKNVALTLAAVGALPRKNRAGLPMDEFLAHSLAVGGISRWVANTAHLGVKQADRAFLVGLLHAFGQVVLALELPEVYSKLAGKAVEDGVALHTLEEAELGTNHFRISAMVAERWQLDQGIVDTVHYYRVSPPDFERSPLMNALWAGAAIMANHQGKPFNEPMPQGFEAHLGTDIDQLLAQKENVQAAIDRTQIFSKI